MTCRLCPRKCGADRVTTLGFCQMGEKITAARASLHFWEEPCISGISGKRGSGTVFFSGCVMKCVYCQNFEISAESFGEEITTDRLSEIFLKLQEQGALNINLVNPTHFVPQMIRSLKAAKAHGLKIPVVYNSGGYERVETLKALNGLVDIYLPDVKYFDDELALRLSDAPDYFNTAINAVSEMVRQTGKPVFEETDGEGKILLKGTIVRHLVLPDCYKDSINVINRVAERFRGEILFSLMSQYTPFGLVKTDENYKKMNRRITTFEYQKALDAVIDAGLEGYAQEKSSAREEYTPSFDLTGINQRC
ncbi:MAG: radical SAM protein [Oscillospiraceae bacterium]|nr:radical SAM protein [Oscillospiraceae bacterium]